MRLATRQPEVAVGLPHVSVHVVTTGDPQIDAGLEPYLLRQKGVDAVSTRRLGETEVVYNVGLDLMPPVGKAVYDLSSGIVTYYASWGMTPQLRVVNDL